jgi:hypothetical protein
MSHYHHLYPYSPWGLHGGTMRLRTAIEASLLRGTATLSWWDRTGSAWRSNVSLDSVGEAPPSAVRNATAGNSEGLKRRLFPSTLWESGWKPCSRAQEALMEQRDATIVLHSTFLAPLAARLHRAGQRVIVDVYDAVCRSHYDDATGASLPLRMTRQSYARTVCARERRALGPMNWLVVAGWDDIRVLAKLGVAGMTWVPTGLEAELSSQPDTGQLRVGLLGNHYHSATAQAAAELIASPLGRNRDIQLVLAGIGSERYQELDNVLSLGRIRSTKEFYDQIHATVVPVMNGTGMKCKLGEAALAGKAVITTRLGARGYPPDLRKAFVTVDDTQALDKRTVIDAVKGLSPETRRGMFQHVVGREAAAQTYADVLAHLDTTDVA